MRTKSEQPEATCHKKERGGRVEALAQDRRFAFRMVRKSPAFTLVVIITLALGIGANTLMFSVVNVVLLRPLPFRDPDRLLLVWGNDLKHGQQQFDVSRPDYDDWLQQNRVFCAWFLVWDSDLRLWAL